MRQQFPDKIVWASRANYEVSTVTRKHFIEVGPSVLWAGPWLPFFTCCQLPRKRGIAFRTEKIEESPTGRKRSVACSTTPIRNHPSLASTQLLYSFPTPRLPNPLLLTDKISMYSTCSPCRPHPSICVFFWLGETMAHPSISGNLSNYIFPNWFTADHRHKVETNGIFLKTFLIIVQYK